MNPADGLRQTVGHHRPRADHHVDQTLLDHLAQHPAHFRHGHGTGHGCHDGTLDISGHGLEHLIGLAQLSSAEGGLGHFLKHVRQAADLLDIERLDRLKAVISTVVKVPAHDLYLGWGGRLPPGSLLSRHTRTNTRITREEQELSDPLVPKQAFFTKGVGRHRERLQSFELALRAAGIEVCNLVRVSSIFPPGCKVISRNHGLGKLQPGQITYCVLSEASTQEPSRLVGAGVGFAVPASGSQYGYISEHHGYGLREAKIRDLVEDMAATMLATTLGIEFDPEIAYDERKEIYHMSGKIVRTRACVQTAAGDKNGRWTTVVAAAVFVT